MSQASMDAASDQKKLWLALPFILIGPFLSLFDQSVVNLSAAAINASLHLSVLEIQAVVGGYALTYGLGLIFGGELGDAYGRRRLFRIGMLMFGMTSLLCGIAPDALTMVVGRLLQGLSAAILLPQVLALIRVLFTPAERPRALSWFVTTIGLGMVCGQILGGFIPSWDLFGLSWRPIFLVTVPLCALSWYATGRLLDDGVRATRRPNLDIYSFLLLAGGYGLILLPVANVSATPFLYQGALELLVGLAVLAGFGYRQRQLTHTGKPAMMPAFLFRNRTYVIGVLLNGMLYAAGIPFFFVLGLYLLGALHDAPATVGLAFSPIAVGVMLGAKISPRLLARFGAMTIPASLLLMAAGIGGCLLLTRSASLADGALLLLEIAVLIFGLGYGIALPMTTGVVLTQLPPERAGIGASILTVAQQLGGVAGFAVTGAATLTAVPNVAPNFTKGFFVQVGFACAAIICAWALALRVKAE